MADPNREHCRYWWHKSRNPRGYGGPWLWRIGTYRLLQDSRTGKLSSCSGAAKNEGLYVFHQKISRCFLLFQMCFNSTEMSCLQMHHLTWKHKYAYFALVQYYSATFSTKATGESPILSPPILWFAQNRLEISENILFSLTPLIFFLAKCTLLDDCEYVLLSPSF